MTELVHLIKKLPNYLKLRNQLPKFNFAIYGLKYFLLLLCIFSSSVLFSQNLVLQKEIEHYNKIIELFNDNKFDSVIHVHNNVISKNSFNNKIYSVENYIAKSYFEIDSVGRGMDYLEKVIMQGFFSEIGQVKYQYRKYHLEKNDRFAKIIADDISVKNDYSSTNYKPKSRELYLEIFNTDFRLRQLLNLNTGIDSIREVQVLFRQNDSLNASLLLDLIQVNNGFPTHEEIGDHHLFQIIWHLKHILDLDFVFNEMRKVTILGKLHNKYTPTLIDHIRRKAGKKGLYGVHTTTDENGQQQFAEIEDISNVDVRRKEYLLPTLKRQSEIDNIVLPADYFPQN